MAANALKKITNRAKEIVRKHPGKKWSTAVKEAGRDYRAGKIGGTRTKKKTSGAKKKPTTLHRRTSIGATPAAGGSLEAQLRRQYKEQLGWCLATRETAKTKTEKNKLSRKAVEIRKKLRALS